MSATALSSSKSTTAGPFLKWAGGKSQLLGQILPRLPQRIRTYYEPFMGGGAVFFALANEGRFERAVLGDRNPHLVEVYTVVRDQVDALIDELTIHAEHGTDKEYYYAIRSLDQTGLTPVARAARLIYMNKTCFNGLYRVNRKGGFNVPFGRYKNPRVLNEPRLRAASRALAPVEIVNEDFETLAARAGPEDAVYFDPPYVPVSATSSFTAYDACPFTKRDHFRLVRVYRQCWTRDAVAVLSNSDCAMTRAIYQGLDVETVNATRAINSKADRRGTVTEVLVVGVRADAEQWSEDSALPAAAEHMARRRRSA